MTARLIPKKELIIYELHGTKQFIQGNMVYK